MQTEEKGETVSSFRRAAADPLFVCEKSYFWRIAFSGKALHYTRRGRNGGDKPDLGQEEDMPVQDLFVAQAKHEKLQEEKAIVRAVIRYFEKAAPHSHASGAEMESSIVNALHRYFQGSK